ncbi:mycofactocin-coupled SDR family oxidoreductase [Mycobacterium colombiense]|uniref:Oxidoreductase n=1 Tax=Mycobacterium colombiense CECT 3035 TaxID=1041522 RepID=J4JVQ0_9MYCO|nr:mycofactocin-coupled SDR family oxidoreductase [Mycobacterium colombiense]EJO89422.1 oxidoreductase [Mycobacterium colombiense CECT 3035]
MGRVQGKVAFITGVARGQGRSHAVRLAEEGADIIGIDLLENEEFAPYLLATQDDMDETLALVEKTGRRMIGIKADVRDRTALIDAVKTGVDEFGRLDIVVANAGISPTGGMTWEVPPDEWNAVIDINLTGVFNTVAATVPAVISGGNGGSVILTSSGAGLKYVPNLVHYNSAKAAVVAIGKTLSNELAAQQIRVNVIAPGTVNTALISENKAMFKLFRPDLENPTIEDAEPVFTMMMPMGKPWVEPSDISNAVLYLASDEARYVTGIVLPVDMGALNRP